MKAVTTLLAGALALTLAACDTNNDETGDETVGVDTTTAMYAGADVTAESRHDRIG